MKVLYTLCLLFLLIGNCFSQTPQSSPSAPQDLIVIEKQWRVEIHNPLMSESPLDFLDRVSQAEMDRIRQAEAVNRQVQQRQNQSQNPNQPRPSLRPQMIRLPDPKPVTETEPEVKTDEPRAVYIYKVKVRNDGEKPIQALMWEYVFSEVDSGREIGRRRFVSKTKIAPGKTKELTMRSASPPTGSINAATSGKKTRDQYSEQVVIQVIQYEDGTIKETGKASAEALPVNRATKN